MSAIITLNQKGEDLINLEGLVSDWLTQCERDYLSLQTVNLYRHNLKKFLWWAKQFHPDKTHPRLITPKEIKGYLDYLRATNKERWGLSGRRLKEQLTPNGIMMYASSVKGFFSWLELESYIELSPFRHKSININPTRRGRLEAKPKPVEDVPQEDLQKLLAHVSSPDYIKFYAGCRNRAAILLLLDSGMRRGELLSMRVCDLNMTLMRCNIRGKTGERVIFFSPVAKAALADYWTRFRAKQANQPESEYWRTGDDCPLCYTAIGVELNSLSKKLNIKLHAHKLRHTFATLMADKVGLYELSALLGHSSPMTTKRYVHKNKTNLLAAAYQGRSPLTQIEIPQPVKHRRGRPRVRDKGV